MTPFQASPLLLICGSAQRAQAFPCPIYLRPTNPKPTFLQHRTMDYANQQQPGQPYKCLVSATPACARKHIAGAVACVHIQSVSPQAVWRLSSRHASNCLLPLAFPRPRSPSALQKRGLGRFVSLHPRHLPLTCLPPTWAARRRTILETFVPDDRHPRFERLHRIRRKGN
jgi:hypothetical protein